MRSLQPQGQRDRPALCRGDSSRIIGPFHTTMRIDEKGAEGGGAAADDADKRPNGQQVPWPRHGYRSLLYGADTEHGVVWRNNKLN